MSRARGKRPAFKKTKVRRGAAPSGDRARHADRVSEGAEALGDHVRLQKVLARAGVASRRASEQLIEQGRVMVNDQVVTELGSRVNPAKDQIVVDGTPIAVETPVYIVMNKPEGVVCSAQPDVDERGRPTVVSLLKGVTQRVYPVGRLDFRTRGVLILTNDGDLASRLAHPRHGVPKTYHAKFQGLFTATELDALRAGVTLEDGTPTKPPHEVLVVKETDSNTWIQLTISQGIYRQIRRIGEVIAHPVLKLIRVAYADITTDGLSEGKWRLLREAELGDLRTRTGLGGGRETKPLPRA